MARKAVLTILVLTLLGLNLISLYPAKVPLRVNTTRSMPRGIWIVIDAAPSKGAFVTVAGYLRGKKILKKVVGAPGDSYEIDTAVVINGNELPGSKVVLSRREKKARTGTLGDDEWIVLGTHQGSYDSRYFGPVRTENIVNVLEPYLTLE